MEIRLDVVQQTIESLPALDAAACGVVLDERPLHGPAGRIDWRLCGKLSQQLLERRYQGALGEDMLVSTGARLPFGRTFLFGLGRDQDIDEALVRQVVGRSAGVLIRAGVTSVAMGLWDLTRERLPFEDGLEAFLQGCARVAAKGPTEQDCLDVFLLARNPSESGRMSHHIEQRVRKPGPEGLQLTRLMEDSRVGQSYI